MRRFIVLFAVISVVVGITACSRSNPAGPSGSGVTLSGSIVSGAALGRAGLTVSVRGTNISSPVDASHSFSLANVPAGTPVLQFRGAGTSADVTMGAVTDGEHVTVHVKVDDSSAEIEDVSSDDPPSSSTSQIEVEGLVTSLPPVTAAGSFILNGTTTILTNGSTKYRHGDTTKLFTDLQIGTRVHVTGTASGTSVLATEVIFQDPNTNTNVNLEGTVSGLSGTQTAFQFTLNGTSVHGNSSTTFQGGAFANLANGTKVNVKAEQQNGFVLATNIHIQK